VYRPSRSPSLLPKLRPNLPRRLPPSLLPNLLRSRPPSLLPKLQPSPLPNRLPRNLQPPSRQLNLRPSLRRNRQPRPQRNPLPSQPPPPSLQLSQQPNLLRRRSRLRRNRQRPRQLRRNRLHRHRLRPLLQRRPLHRLRLPLRQLQPPRPEFLRIKSARPSAGRLRFCSQGGPCASTVDTSRLCRAGVTRHLRSGGLHLLYIPSVSLACARLRFRLPGSAEPDARQCPVRAGSGVAPPAS